MCIFLWENFIILGFTYVTMEDCWVMCNKWIKFYVYCCFVGTLFWLSLPLAYGDRSLPLSCWYPFDYKVGNLLGNFSLKKLYLFSFCLQEPFVYEAMYFLQFVGQIQVAAAFSASSGFHMVLGILISGQYDVLNCSLKNILATVALNNNSTKTELK